MSKQRQPAARTGLDHASTIPVVPLVTLVTLVAAYWIAFYAAVPLRLQYLATLVLPDQVWDDWTAGEGWPHLLDRLPIWLLASYYLAVAWAAGRLALRWLRPADFTALERFVFAISLGLGLLSTATLLIGLAGGLRLAWLFRVGTALILLTEILLVVRRGQAKVVRVGRIDRSSVWLGCLFGLLVFIYALAATLPPTDFDVCEYHLQVPKEWFLTGRIEFLPHNVYGNMPLGAEMHALACMELWPASAAWWYGALAGKVVMALFAPLTALALYTAGLRWFSQPAGVIAAAVYLTFPWIAHVSFNGLNDGVLAHYVFVAMYAAMLAGVDWRTQLLAGLLAGCAAACKYPGLIFVALPVVLIIVLRARMDDSVAQRSRKAISGAMVVGVGLLLMAGPWYVKNAVLTGNPVYPLAATWLDGQTRTPEKTAQWNRAHQTPRDAAGNTFSIGQWLEAKKRVGLTSEWLSPIALPLAILGLFATYRKRETQLSLAVIAWIFTVWFFATHRIDRFWLPAVPLLCLMAGAAWQWSDHKLYRRALTGLAVAGLSAALLMIVAPVYVDGSRTIISSPYWLASLERLRKEGPLPSHRLLNQQSEGTTAVLLVGDAIPFDLEMPTYYNTCFDDNVFELLTKNRSPDDIREAFRERKIAYVLVDWAEIARYRRPGNYGFTDYVQPEVFRQLVAEQILEPPQRHDDDGRWEVYRVRP